MAAYFQALSEPTRLQILNLLRSGERSVGDLAQLCSYTSANILRHLAFLMQQGLVERDGCDTSVYYRIGRPERVCALRPGVRQHRAPARTPGQRPRGLRPRG